MGFVLGGFVLDLEGFCPTPVLVDGGGVEVSRKKDDASDCLF